MARKSVQSSRGVAHRVCGPLFLALVAALLACDNKGSATTGGSDLAARGKIVYQTNCIACHNTDPSKPGTLGPEIKGSPLELIEARVMRKEYPAGYTPKRQTQLMTPLPQLKEDIPALHAYLNQ